MEKSFVQKILSFCLIVLTIAIFSGQLRAQDKKSFDTKRRTFCKLMLDYGEEAFKRGDFEKAGYYFQQAVQADPAQIAKSWFQMKSGDGEPDEGATPSAPADAPAEKGDGEVIMGDDEGC